MGSVSELTLLADLRPELVEIRQTMTHATRLRILLRTLYGIRRAGIEESIQRRPRGPLERLEFLHFVRFALLDGDTKFLLAVTFDGAWEPYIRAIAEQAGPLLDVIFCHTQGYNAHSSDRGYLRFAEWVRRHQVETDFFFADAPGTTARDVRLLQAFEQETNRPAFSHVDASLPFDEGLSPEAERRALADEVRRGLKALHLLHGLDRYFPAPNENAFLRRTARMILEELPIEAGLAQLAREGRDGPHRAAARWVAEAPPVERPAPAPAAEPADPANVQANILDGYRDRTHGAMLLLRVTDLSAARAFLGRLEPTTWAEQEAGALPDVTVNVGITFQGLRSLGVPESLLDRLPQEFREGMAARAGWLGDLGPNHPSHWRLPRIGWPLDESPRDLRVRLSSVDLVVQLQARVEVPPPPDDHRFGPDHPLHDFVAEHFGDAAGTGLQLLAVEPTRHAQGQPATGLPWPVEHFGYLDGISQPTHRAGGPERDRVALGELLIGHADDRDGVAARAPIGLLQDGSFQAVRKLRQHVGRFRALLDRYRHSVPDLAERMMGWRLADDDPLWRAGGRPETANDFDYADDEHGRRTLRAAHVRRTNPRNGPSADDRVRNATRRAVPRIARRGLSYGPAFDPDGDPDRADDGEERGLLFTAFAASLADQFEVVQRWLAGGNPTDALSTENDPFLGLPEPGRHKRLRLPATDAHPARTIDLGPEPLVSLDWGLYLFVPSRSALRQLADGVLAPEPDATVGAPGAAIPLEDDARLDEDWASAEDVAEGEGVIRRMEQALAFQRMRDPAGADGLMALRWKVLIEDLSARETMRKVWAAIRARGGVLTTPYGVLVGSRETVESIFADPDAFSVSGYWSRMRDSLGEHYLGMDPRPRAMAAHATGAARVVQDRFLEAVGETRYAEESRVANAWIASIGPEEAFDHALRTTGEVLDESIGAMRPAPTVIDLRRLVQDVVARMGTDWFALPDRDGWYMTRGGPTPARAHCPDHFGATARYIFSPNPTEFVRREGREKGQELLIRAKAFVRSVRREAVEASTLLGALFAEAGNDAFDDRGRPQDDFADFCAGLLVGTIHGFVGPVGGSAFSLLNEWTESRMLWRQQQALLLQHPRLEESLDWAAVSPILLPAVKRGMRIQPFPYILHRTPVRDVRLPSRPRRAGALEGELEVTAGTRIVLGIVSAAHDRVPQGVDELDVLFGGVYPVGRGAPLGRGTPLRRGAPLGPVSPGGARKTGLHACPGRDLGLGTIMGILTALCRAGNLRRIASLKLELAAFADRPPAGRAEKRTFPRRGGEYGPGDAAA